MQWITAHWNDVLACIGGAVSLATLIVKLTPSTRDDSVLSWVVGWLNHLSVVNPNQPKQ